MNKTEIIRRGRDDMDSAYQNYLAKEAKLNNIMAKYGKAPLKVWQEFNQAEAEYGLCKAIWKDDSHDPDL